MSQKFDFIEGSIPEGGAAHMIIDLGKVVIAEDLSDEIIELLPEEIQAKYFKKKALAEVEA
jgi:hypothetical protein